MQDLFWDPPAEYYSMPSTMPSADGQSLPKTSTSANHFPTVFDERGNLIGPINKPSHQQYFAEFKYTSSKFLEMIDTILEASRNPPVIIFQADHGSTDGATRA